MSKGRFLEFGGQYAPETMMSALTELEDAYRHYSADPAFRDELSALLCDYAGRPSRLTFAEKMTRDLGGARIYLKREDLNHTGSHKINNVLGQVLLAKKWEKRASSPKPAQGSTVLPRRLWRLSWIWNARFSWAKRTRSVRL